MASKLQGEHLGNLGRMWNEKLSPLAGPCGDNGFIRGIVIIKVRSLAELKRQLKPDPFVQNNYLGVVAIPVKGNWQDIKRIEPTGEFKLGQYTLALIKKGRHWNSWDKTWVSLHTDYQNSLLDKGELSVWAKATDNNDIQACQIFKTADGKKVRDFLANDPSVKSGFYEFETHPQYLQADIFEK